MCLMGLLCISLVWMLGGKGMNRKTISVGDRVETIKGRGVVMAVAINGEAVIVDLDGDHGSYYFSENEVWFYES